MRDHGNIVYGLHAVQALLQHTPNVIQELFIQQGSPNRRLREVISLAKQAGVAPKAVSRHELDGLVDAKPHQGVVALCESRRSFVENDLDTLMDALNVQPFLLVLDGVQDPHNLGACLRTANAAGVHAVIAPKDKATGLTPIARKAASGAAEMTPFIQVTNLARTLRRLKDRGIWLFGATDDSDVALYNADLTGPMAWVLGAEGTGLRRLTRELCDHVVRIPMAGSVSSLNVSVAAGVCLFETVRQGKMKTG